MPTYPVDIQDKLDDLQALTGADRKPAELWRRAVLWKCTVVASLFGKLFVILAALCPLLIRMRKKIFHVWQMTYDKTAPVEQFGVTLKNLVIGHAFASAEVQSQCARFNVFHASPLYRQMLPDPTVNNFFNKSLRNAVLFAQLLLAYTAYLIAAANLHNLRFRQFRHAALLTAPAALRLCVRSVAKPGRAAALALTIGHVLGIGSQEKMIGSHAQAVRPIAGRVIPVAIVTYIQTLWNWPISQFIRYSVCTYALPVNECSAIACCRETASSPNPTSLSFTNVFPKPLLNRDGFKCGVLHKPTPRLEALTAAKGRWSSPALQSPHYEIALCPKLVPAVKTDAVKLLSWIGGRIVLPIEASLQVSCATGPNVVSVAAPLLCLELYS